MNRRDFLASVPLALASTALTPSRSLAETDGAKSNLATQTPSPSHKMSAPAAHELDFATALQAAEAIRTKKISSVELTQRMFARIDHYNPQLNVFAYQLREDALAQAKKADAALAQGKHQTARPRRFPRRSHYGERKLCRGWSSMHVGISAAA